MSKLLSSKMRKTLILYCLEKKTKSNDGSGFCPNVTFEDDEFKEDNKALNDQGEGEGTKSF